MKTSTEKIEILIVGAGPVGMLIGLILARKGREVRIIDQAPGPCAHSYGLALHRPVLRALQKVGMLEDIMSLAYPLERMGVFEERSPLMTVRFEEVLSDDGIPFLVTLSQADFEKILLDHLRRTGVEVTWAHRAAGFKENNEEVSVQVQELEEHLTGYAVAHFESMVAAERLLRASWVLACDGWRSPTRRSLRIPWKVFSEPTEYAFFEFETWTDQHYELELAMEGKKAHVSWPLGPHYARWCFELPLHPATMGAREKEREYIFVGGYPSASPERVVFDRLLERAAPCLGSPPEHLRWRVVVPFAKAMAETFCEGRVALFGDAAHTALPGGVQNMNTSLLEAVEAAPILAAVAAGERHRASFESCLSSMASAWNERLSSHSAIRLGEESRHVISPAQATAVFENLPASREDLLDLAEAVGLVIPETLAQAVAPLTPA
jgi:2-polyprenyl-6-methoxyphenol hydroxylase-like FAD-dependent oxidoreductase